MAYEIRNGECAEVMASMDECSVDAIVTDPPYGLAFMGAKWDSFGGSTGNQTVSERQAEGRRNAEENKGAPRYGNSHGHALNRGENVAFQEAMTPVFEEALRVAKPGAYLLAFGSPRTFHRLFCAIEDAGWVTRNCVMWIYSQGFPKGLNVGKAFESSGDGDLAERWDGWNTQIKPAWEPILMAQRPLDGTVVHNVETHGVGALNVGACRVPTSGERLSYGTFHSGGENGLNGTATFKIRERRYPEGYQPSGRFPANLVHDGSDEVLACFPDAKGQQGDLRGGIPKRTGVCYGDYPPTKEYMRREEADTSAARFFYCAKASKRDRNRGGVTNDHPTCKPNALMRWLVRLVCPKGGLVLDPFMGSGSTGVACMDEGMDFVGIDMDAHYCDIAEARIRAAEADNAQGTLF